MRLDSLKAANQAIITKYLDILKLLKATIKRLKGYRKSSKYSYIAKIILVFKYILLYYKQRIAIYNAINYNAYNKAPKDYFTINLRAA